MTYKTGIQWIHIVTISVINVVLFNLCMNVFWLGYAERVDTTLASALLTDTVISNDAYRPVHKLQFVFIIHTLYHRSYFKI